MFLRLFILLVYLYAGSASCLAQIEVNPYLGIFSGGNELRLFNDNDGLDVYEGQQYAIGLDALFGAGHLAPTAGLLFRPGQFESETAESFTLHRLHLPLGLAYRVLAPDFDINLVPSAAIVPGLVFGEGGDLEHTLDWTARAGVRLYLDWFTLGAYYFKSFTDHYPSGEHEEGRMLYTLGVRF